MSRTTAVLALAALVAAVLGLTASEARGAPQKNPKSQVELPGTPAGLCADAYFKAFNSGDHERMRSFYERYHDEAAFKKRSIKERLEGYDKLREKYKTLTPRRVVLSLERQITMTVISGKRELRIMRLELADEPPHLLESTTTIGPFPLEAAAGRSDQEIAAIIDRSMLIDAEIVADTVKTVAEILRDKYVDPEKGAKMADLLTRRLARGYYKGIDTSGKLADKLTDNAFTISRDLHLWIEAANPHNPQSVVWEHNDPDEVARQKYGFRKIEVLPQNIGFIKFDMFRDNKEALETAAEALAAVADCEALIFDLRDNHGGRPEMIRFICSYLFDKPTVLNQIYDRGGNLTLENKTLAEIPGKRFDPDLPVYILTSGRTGSAAEDFTYALKHLKRATIVGEKTKGMAHPSEDCIVNKYFRMLLPVERMENPITKTSFEGVGVIPHIQTSAARALDAARKDAARKIKARAKGEAPD